MWRHEGKIFPLNLAEKEGGHTLSFIPSLLLNNLAFHKIVNISYFFVVFTMFSVNLPHFIVSSRTNLPSMFPFLSASKLLLRKKCRHCGRNAHGLVRLASHPAHAFKMVPKGRQTTSPRSRHAVLSNVVIPAVRRASSGKKRSRRRGRHCRGISTSCRRHFRRPSSRGATRGRTAHRRILLCRRATTTIAAGRSTRVP